MTRIDYYGAITECVLCMLDDLKNEELESDDKQRCIAALMAVQELNKGFSRTTPPAAVGAA